MVFNCMIKGAADFLIKPVRRNDLRNLCHHVWRIHMIAGEHVPHTEHKFEATVENDAQSNYGSSIQSYRHTTKQMYKGGRNPAFVKGVTQNDATGFQSKRGNVDVMVRVGCNDELAEPPTGAIDLVGSFNNQPRSTFALSRLSDSMSRSNFLHSWSFV
ncbi:hypothetical protein V6N13_079651 [Hibiscus sabdariffa]